jgi:serine/threonine-protein kinase
MDPRSGHLAYEIGETMIDLGRYDEAVVYLDRAIGIAPDFTVAHVLKLHLYLYQADLDGARAVLEAMPYKPRYYNALVAILHYYGRDFGTALSFLNSPADPAISEHLFYLPVAEMIATTYSALGEADSARAYFEASRAHLEPLVAAEPNDPRFRSALGVAYAGLGLREEAIREGGRGVELMPVSKDSKQGPPRRFDLARVHLLLGDFDAAVDELEYVLSIPASPTRVPLLRINPFWDPLRDHPRFQKLIE